MVPTLDVTAQDTPFDPSARERIALTRRVDDRILYQVVLRSVGSDLPLVERAICYLRPSVSDAPQVGRRTPASPDCRLVLWLWGAFPLTVVVQDLKDGVHELPRTLRFDDDFAEPKFEQERLKVQPS